MKAACDRQTGKGRSRAIDQISFSFEGRASTVSSQRAGSRSRTEDAGSLLGAYVEVRSSGGLKAEYRLMASI